MQHTKHHATHQGIVHHGEAGAAAYNDIFPADTHDIAHQAAGFPGSEQQTIVAVIHAVLSHHGGRGICNGPHGIRERQLIGIRLAPCHIEVAVSYTHLTLPTIPPV